MTYLITGISGFLGEAITRKLTKEGHIVKGLARNEGKLIDFKAKYPEVEIITGDVSDSWSVAKAMKGVDGVIHAAAYKHVGLAEDHVFECIKSNITGSINVLEQSFIEKPVFVIGISTDKAAQPTGVYGKSKQLMERLFNEAEKINPQTKYRIVRYGNVLGSTGSILPKWKKIIEQGGEITITDPDATRFFFTVEEAVDLIFEALENAKDSTPYIPKMKAMSVGDFLEAVMQKYGKVKKKTIGLQPGENAHETMGAEYSNEVERFTINEIKEKI